jgi:transcription elongation factor GreA
MTTSSDAWLTQEAYDKLRADLEQLQGPARAEIARRIDAARQEGDLSENGGYHAAKEEQGKIEARIRQLQDLLRRAVVGERPPDDGLVEPGMVVTIRFAGDTDTERFLLGSRELAQLDESVDVEVYSTASPLGAAVNGTRVGDTVEYEAPNGRTFRVEIVAATPFGA